MLAVVVMAQGPARGAAVASFQGLGNLSGGAFESYAAGVSGDGSAVVGAGHQPREPRPSGGPQLAACKPWETCPAEAIQSAGVV
jgi:hypothetical protein